MEELESYAKQVEEFQTYGDMSEINRYLKKSQALDSKLQIAADKVSLLDWLIAVHRALSAVGKTLCWRDHIEFWNRVEINHMP